VWVWLRSSLRDGQSVFVSSVSFWVYPRLEREDSESSIIADFLLLSSGIFDGRSSSSPLFEG
jgi:hypothetical protein